MANRIDLTGMTFNRMKVIHYIGKKYYMCQCVCGKTKNVLSSNLTSGQVKSCGCLRDERTKASNSIHGDATRTSGKKRLWKIWVGMRRRCNDKGDPLYGGRGISVCEAWMYYQPFKVWALENGYADELSIDRIDPNGDYEPSNCRWVAMKEQQRNRRSNKMLEFNGKTLSVAEWAEITGISATVIYARVDRLGWTAERALSEPVHKIFQ